MRRLAGVLLHPTSLPGRFGIGDLGASARSFVDWLASAGVALWQVLPLVPTGGGASPYSSWSAFAGNPDLVDMSRLVDVGLLTHDELTMPVFPNNQVDFEGARAARNALWNKAFERLFASDTHPLRAEVRAFAERTPWATDTALFAALKEKNRGAPWWEWPTTERDRDPATIKTLSRELAKSIERHVTQQFFFETQWQALRRYANERGVRIVGDIPIYVDGDSVDVWMNRRLFELDERGLPSRVAGVPPDAFSEMGQRWGNPLYNWDAMAKDNYAWWVDRVRRLLTLCDWVRIDHFRGLAAYWAVPSTSPDARSGTWVKGPGVAFFKALTKALGPLPIIAEDLGVIDDEVRGLLADANLPGMRVLQFAFGVDSGNAYLPHNYARNAVVYTGTHDNDTTLGWWHVQNEHTRHHVRTYLGVDGHDIAWDLIRAALASTANFAIVPMQDLLSQPGWARMNTPAVADGNWRYRMAPSDLRGDVAERLRELVTLYGRLP